MSAPHTQRRMLTLENLEPRDVPAAESILIEPFQRGPMGGLPSGWSQWSNDGSRSFQVDADGVGLGDVGRLVTNGTSKTSGRAWVSTTAWILVEKPPRERPKALHWIPLFRPTHLDVRGPRRRR